MENQLIIYGTILAVSTIIQLIILFVYIGKQNSEIKAYIENITYYTIAQIKNELHKTYRYFLIKNLKFMKKYIGWSILLITLTIIGIGTLIVYDSREFFKDYFEKERTKLSLRTEQSVDSLQSIINKQIHYSDSLFNIIKLNNDRFAIFDKQIIELDKTIKNLNNVISHQNNIIKSHEIQTK